MVHTRAPAKAAQAYNQAGGDYAIYAEGDPTRLFAFEGLHAYADRQVWALPETKLIDVRASGANSVSILDAGCGQAPGCAALSHRLMRWDSPALLRAVLTLHGRRFNARGCWLAIS